VFPQPSLFPFAQLQLGKSPAHVKDLGLLLFPFWLRSRTFRILSACVFGIHLQSYSNKIHTYLAHKGKEPFPYLNPFSLKTRDLALFLGERYYPPRFVGKYSPLGLRGALDC